MVILQIVLAVFLVLLNGFFVLAEFALVKVRSTRIEELAKSGQDRALIVRHMVRHLDAYLTATQLGITVASLGLGWVGEPAFSTIIAPLIDRLPLSSTARHALSMTFAFTVITFLHLLVGELAPKRMAIRRPEKAALFSAYPLLWAYRAVWLPMVVLNGAANWLLRTVGLDATPEVTHSDQELRMLLSNVETSHDFSMSRLFMLENIFDLGTQTVVDAMIPWSRVVHLTLGDSRAAVLRVLREHRFSRYPVLHPTTKMPSGYLLMKDLVVQEPGEQWQPLIRPLRVVKPSDNLELTMHALQQDGGNMAVAIDAGRPVGLITLEDILEEVVGRIEDEYPRLPRLFLKDALALGGVVLDFPAASAEDVIRRLAAQVPVERLPKDADVCKLALDRERQMPTIVGHGVAIPHARCPGLAQPLIVFGRAEEGLVTKESAEPVRLYFLLVTPSERPNLQVFFLSQVASVIESDLVRERLCRADTPQEVLEIIAAADPAITG